MPNPKSNTVRLLFYAFVITALVAGALAGGHVLLMRHRSEKADPTVEMAADLEDFKRLARLEEVDEDQLWAMLKEAGVTTLAIPETTVRELMREGRITALSGGRLLSHRGSGELLAPGFRTLLEGGGVAPEHTYILADDAAVGERLTYEICRRVQRSCLLHPVGGGAPVPAGAGGQLPGDAVPAPAVLEVPLGFDTLRSWGLGISPDHLALAARHGFMAIPRLEDYPAADGAKIREDFAALDGKADINTVIFNGREILGAASGSTAVTREEIARRGWVPGAIEAVTLLSHFPQAGLTELVEEMDYQAARVYSIAPEYQNQLSRRELVEIWTRSPWERNIRVIYIRPFLDAPHGERLEKTLGTIADTAAGLQKAGFRLGPAGTFPPVNITPIHRFALAALIWAAFLALIHRLGMLKPAVLLVLGALGMAGWAGLYYLGFWPALAKLAGLGAAIVAPLWAFELVFRRWRPGAPRGAADGITDLLAASGVSLAGALIMAAAMSDLPFLLEFDYFRGVKAALLLPPALVAVLYLWHLGFETVPPRSDGGREPGGGAHRWERLKEQVEWILGRPINIGHALLGSVAAVAVLLVVVRSGNLTREMVPELELQIRSLLEGLLAVRPRFKEFAVGHPLMVMAGWVIVRRRGPWLGLFAVAGAVGQTSLINSFSHLRTPVGISLARTAHGLWLGIALGLLGILALEVLWRLWNRADAAFGGGGGQRR